MLKFFDNDTIALVCLGAVALSAVFMGSDAIVTGALGAIAGFIGSKGLHSGSQNKPNPDKNEPT